MQYNFTRLTLILTCLFLVSAFTLQQVQQATIQKHPLIQQLQDAFFDMANGPERHRLLKEIRQHPENMDLLPALEDFYYKMCLQVPPSNYVKGNPPLYQRKEHAQVEATIVYLKMLKEGVTDFDAQTDYLLANIVRKTEKELDYVSAEHVLLLERMEDDEKLEEKLLSHLEGNYKSWVKLVALNLLERKYEPEQFEQVILERIDKYTDDLAVFNWLLEGLLYNGGTATAKYFSTHLQIENKEASNLLARHAYTAGFYKKNKKLYEAVAADSTLQAFLVQRDETIAREKAKKAASMEELQKDQVALRKYYKNLKSKMKPITYKAVTSEQLNVSYKSATAGCLKRGHWGAFFGEHSNQDLISILQNSTNKIEKRIAAYVLGSRALYKDKTYPFSEYETRQINQIVEDYAQKSLYYQLSREELGAKLDEIEESRTQVVRLSYLVLPTALDYLLSEDTQEIQWASQVMCQLRSRRAAEAVLKVYEVTQPSEAKERLHQILTRGFNNSGYTLIANRQPMSVEDYQPIHWEVIQSALK